MMIDEKGKLFGKISVIDCLIILVLVIAIAGCAYKFLGNDDLGVTKSDSFTTVVKINGVRAFYLDAIKKGEVIYEQYGNELGTVTAIEVEPYRAVLSGDKEGQLLTYSDRYTIYLTLASKGTVNDNGFFAGGTRQVYGGSSVNIESRLFTGSMATIDSVSK